MPTNSTDPVNKKSNSLKLRLSSYEKTCSSLNKELKTHLLNHTTGATKNKVFAETLGTIGRLEYFAPLREAFKDVGHAFRSVADERLNVLGDKKGLGGEKLLNRLEETKKGVLVPMKAVMKDRSDVVSLVAKEEKKHQVSRASFMEDENTCHYCLN
jgi:hypothetical protein